MDILSSHARPLMVVCRNWMNVVVWFMWGCVIHLERSLMTRYLQFDGRGGNIPENHHTKQTKLQPAVMGRSANFSSELELVVTGVSLELA